jgi:hypothetical protein
VSDPLPVVASALAAEQIRVAEEWWRSNRSKAPHVFREDLRRVKDDVQRWLFFLRDLGEVRRPIDESEALERLTGRSMLCLGTPSMISRRRRNVDVSTASDAPPLRVDT